MRRLAAQPAGMSASENVEQSLSTHSRHSHRASRETVLAVNMTAKKNYNRDAIFAINLSIDFSSLISSDKSGVDARLNFPALI